VALAINIIFKLKDFETASVGPWLLHKTAFILAGKVKGTIDEKVMAPWNCD